MSIRKPSAPRLPASRSNTPACVTRAGSTSVDINPSTSSRMRSRVAHACSMPSTDSTPRMADNWCGTAIKTSLSDGLRKNWSISRSASDNETRSSCTTLPMVWRSETRRYSSSIQASSGCAGAPWPTDAIRSARRCTRPASPGASKAASSSAASMYSSAVATSMAKGAGGAMPLCCVCAMACCNSWASDEPETNRRLSDSLTSADCSARPLRRCISPAATADHDSLAAATRLRAWLTQAGSNRPSELVL